MQRINIVAIVTNHTDGDRDSPSVIFCNQVNFLYRVIDVLELNILKIKTHIFSLYKNRRIDYPFSPD